jgi:hypothetical protein
MNNNNIKELARAQARELLARSSSFHGMNREEQLTLYKDLVNATYNKLAEQEGLSTQLASKKPEKASDRIDDERHYNKRIEQAGDLAGEFVDSVDFPGFVRDLLKGVFDANLEVTLKQMDEYIKLMKAATASISKFVNAIDNTAAFGYLAENQDDEFGLDFSDEEKDEKGNPKPILTNKSGEPMDIGDNAVKAKIMEAKIAMAKEQRALLRETILMGVTRLVVEKGTVKAGVLFDIKASEKIEKKDKAALKKSESRGSSIRAGGGLIGKIFGGPSGGTTRSSRKTEISVSSAKSKSSTDLAAKLSGNVEIIFKSDYFKLDNFAEMYKPVKGEEEVKEAAKT